MEKYRYMKDKENDEYFTFRGRWFDYIYGKDKIEYALRIGETIDYFYFTITALYSDLSENFTVDITPSNAMYNAFNMLMEDFCILDVMEEGTPEKKSLEFKKSKDNIKLTFKNMPSAPKSFCTVEFANIRRWGDTRFANIVSTKEKDFAENPIKVGDFRYEFKGRLHYMFDELEDSFEKEYNINTNQSNIK